MECEVTKPDRAATWYKNGVELQPSDRIVPRVEGTKHFLTIHNSVLDDEDKYSIKVEDSESQGKLYVDGDYLFFSYFLIYTLL